MANNNIKRVIRSLKTSFPFLHDTWFSLKFFLMKTIKIPHEGDFKALRLFTPEPHEIFVDIGSNRGESILSMLITFERDNKIVGFEPNLIIYKKAKKYFHGNRRVCLHNFGLGDKEENASLLIPFYKKWMFDGLSSFRYDMVRDLVEMMLFWFDENKLSIQKVDCQIKTLDEIELGIPYFVKIDAQGYEFNILKGSTNTLQSHHPILLIESIDEETMAFLRLYGYDFYSFEHGQFHKGTGVLNTFCMTTDKYKGLKVK